MITGFETLRIWQEAHRLMIEVHNIARTFPRNEQFRLGNQIERSSSSVAANIAEGYSVIGKSGTEYWDIRISGGILINIFLFPLN